MDVEYWAGEVRIGSGFDRVRAENWQPLRLQDSKGGARREGLCGQEREFRRSRCIGQGWPWRRRSFGVGKNLGIVGWSPTPLQS